VGNLYNLTVLIVFLPLLGSLIIGFLGNQIKNHHAHSIAIITVGLSSLFSCVVFYGFYTESYTTFEATLYNWGVSGGTKLEVGFLIDKLSALMMFIVTFVSLMVHIYTIGYMNGDPGYKRFFCYISFFTFSMLILVTANNFLQLFFGWEAVGLTSYLLIGFWFTRETAIFANLKAFLVNRVGDFGFLLGIAAVLLYFGSLNYIEVFSKVDSVFNQGASIEVIKGSEWSVITLICICLFIGAMGKSAQMPLHIWLPDSMEGPTPISALIHAATMVTAGIFMTTRMSPIFEYSETALTFVLVIGSLTCILMGLIGIVQDDIKRVVAYSTLSQLGLMVASLGVSAYAMGVFHLMTHAFFKALLFLGAGSVIIAMHHEQDIKLMGGLRKYMPITYTVMLFGSLALMGFPGFSGFYSKDLILEAVRLSTLPGSDVMYYLVLSSVFITSLYSFRMFFLVFHTNERMDSHTKEGLKESPITVCLPLVLLAVPSIISGWLFIGPVLNGYFGDSIFILPEHNVVKVISGDFHGALQLLIHGFTSIPCWLGFSGMIVAWCFYVWKPNLAAITRKNFSFLYKILINKYGFDIFTQSVLASGFRKIGWHCWQIGDRLLIDGLIVNGAAKTIGYFAKLIRQVQTGHLYTYVFVMVSGLLFLLLWLTLVSHFS